MTIRDARADDAERISALARELGYEASPEMIAGNLPRLLAIGEPPLVAEEEGEVVGYLTWHIAPVLHRPGPYGRITMLVVAESRRGRGIGRRLVAAAEERFHAHGCALIEVTSGTHRAEAHAFYRRLGYELTSHRFSRGPTARPDPP